MSNSRILSVALVVSSVSGILLLAPSSARATTPAPGPNQMRICLRQNMSGFVDLHGGDRGDQTAWGLHAVYAQLRLGGTVIRGWGPVDKDDACFLAGTAGAVLNYTVDAVSTSGVLSGNNTVVSRGSNGNAALVSANALIGLQATTYSVTLPSNDVMRVYAALVFFIERAFRGNYANENLTSWIGDGGGSNPCDYVTTPTSWCVDGSLDPHISLGVGLSYGDADSRKYAIAHEFGHVNQWDGSTAQFLNDCSLGVQSCPLHNIKTPEWSSCAATEGWAHFYSGDVFNWHSAGVGQVNPQAEIIYIDGSVFNLGSGTGGCYSGTYDCDNTYPGQAPLEFYNDCHGGAFSSQVGVELDWARHWWDYHEDKNKGLNVRSHAQLHDDLSVGGDWTYNTAYQRMKSDLPSGLSTRWVLSAGWNGVCISGTSC
jgi:hypothetical protein